MASYTLRGRMKNMNEIICLIRRDLHLLKSISLKRAVMYAASVVMLDIFFLLAGSEGLFMRSVYGVTAEMFRQEPGLFPYQWLWLQLGPVLTAFDFVREDLYDHSSNVIVKLKYRAYYWISKLVSGAVYCLIIAAFCAAEKTLVMKLFMVGEWGNVYIETAEILQFAVGLFLCVFALFCIYSLLSIILPDIVSFLAVILYICAGLPSGSKILMVNHIMLCRGNMPEGILYIAAACIICLLAGILLLRYRDIITFDR